MSQTLPSVWNGVWPHETGSSVMAWAEHILQICMYPVSAQDDNPEGKLSDSMVDSLLLILPGYLITYT